MAEVFDFKKEYKELYFPKATPCVIEVPEMVFIMVDGKGNPNTCDAYRNALEILYGLSYTIKMSKKSGAQPQGYFEYVVPPLEGLWWGAEGCFDGTNVLDKDMLFWTAMIRQPDFVTPDTFELAKQSLIEKKPDLELSLSRLVSIAEGLCAQIMHTGSYDDEPATIRILDKFIMESGYKTDMNESRKHHEIYLNDPRKTNPEKLKTVIRHPIAER